MPQAFTSQQMVKIREQLFQSACRHAIHQGVRKTSLEALTADAGISKSTFYKFYASKEQLFLEVARHFESAVIGEAERALHETVGRPSKERTAAAVNAVFARLAELNIMRFFQEDLPLLTECIQPAEADQHFRSMVENILELLIREEVRFTKPMETVGAVIHILYLSVQSSREMENFAEALRLLVLGTCEKLVE